MMPMALVMKTPRRARRSNTGGSGEIRTRDQRIKSPLLYRLSYRPSKERNYSNYSSLSLESAKRPFLGTGAPCHWGVFGKVVLYSQQNCLCNLFLIGFVIQLCLFFRVANKGGFHQDGWDIWSP